MVTIRNETLPHQIQIVSSGSSIYVSCNCLAQGYRKNLDGSSRYEREGHVIGGPLGRGESAVDRWRTHLPEETILDYIERLRPDGADGHVALVCDCGRSGCMFCDGGLFACVRCNSHEGATTSECPGSPMSSQTSTEVYWGYLDFRYGMWMPGKISPHCPTWFNEWNPEYVEWRRLHNEKESISG